MTVLEEELPPVSDTDGEAHALDLNGLDLIAGTGTEGYLIEALSDDTTWGNPAAVVTEVLSQLQDGSLASVDSYDNREAIVRVRISGPDGAALAAGEAALVKAVAGTDGRGLLTWTPPADASPPAVFEVVYGHLNFEMDDEAETQTQGPERMYLLTLVCKPFARSVDKIEVPGLPVNTGAAPITIDDGSSVTGWSTDATQRIRHNMFPNPQFQRDLTGIAASSGVEYIERAQTTSGGWYCHGWTTGAPTRAYMRLLTLPVTPGRQYRVKAAQKWNAVNGSSAAMGFMVRWYDDGSNTVAADQIIARRSISKQVWSRGSGMVTAPAGATKMAVYPFGDRPTGHSGNYAIDLDEVFIGQEMSTRPGDPYFDGSTADTSIITYTWDGTADVSASTATYLPPTVTASGGKVISTMYGNDNAVLLRDGIVTMTDGTPYLRISGTYSWDLANNNTSGASFKFRIDDELVTPTTMQVANGKFTAALYLPGRIFNQLRITAWFPGETWDVGQQVAVDSLVIAATPIEATGRQTSRVAPIYGSLRTEADIVVTSTTPEGAPVAFGNRVIVYTVPVADGGASPNMRQWRSSGGTVTADSGRVSGAYENVPTTEATAITWKIPADQVRDGTHALWASAATTAPGTKRLHWSATVATTYTSHTVTGWKDVYLDGTYAPNPIGHVTLPPTAVGPAAEATITIKMWTSSTGTINLDEAWAFNIDDGQVSMVDTSGGVSMVRLSAATIDNPNPGCWIGDADTDINTIHAGARATFDQHIFPPGDIFVFTVALTSTTVSTAFSYYQRFHTYPSPYVADPVDDGELPEEGEE